MYTLGEKIGIAIAASLGPAVLFLIVTVLCIVYALRRKKYDGKGRRRRRHRHSRYINAAYVNGEAATDVTSVNGDFREYRPHSWNVERETTPTWIRMFRPPPTNPYCRYERNGQNQWFVFYIKYHIYIYCFGCIFIYICKLLLLQIHISIISCLGCNNSDSRIHTFSVINFFLLFIFMTCEKKAVDNFIVYTITRDR